MARRFLFASSATSLPVRSVVAVCLPGSSPASVGLSRRQRPSFPRRWEVLSCVVQHSEFRGPNKALQRTAGGVGAQCLAFSPAVAELGSVRRFGVSFLPPFRHRKASFRSRTRPFRSRLPAFRRRTAPFRRRTPAFRSRTPPFRSVFPAFRRHSGPFRQPFGRVHRLTTRSSEQRLAVGIFSQSSLASPASVAELWPLGDIRAHL